MLVGVDLGDGRKPGGFIAEVVVEGVDRLADAMEVSVDRFVQEGHQEAASTAGLLDPFQRQGLGDWKEERFMPEKEQYQVFLRGCQAPPLDRWDLDGFSPTELGGGAS